MLTHTHTHTHNTYFNIIKFSLILLWIVIFLLLKKKKCFHFIECDLIYIIISSPIFMVIILINYLENYLINKFQPSPRTWPLFLFCIFFFHFFFSLFKNNEEEVGIIFHKKIIWKFFINFPKNYRDQVLYFGYSSYDNFPFWGTLWISFWYIGYN